MSKVTVKDATDNAQSQAGATPPPESILGTITGWFFYNWQQIFVSLAIVILILVVMLLSLFSGVGGTPNDLMVITWAQPPSESVGTNESSGEAPTEGVTGSNTNNVWILRGRVLSEPSKPPLTDSPGIEDASVFAVSADRLGTRFSPDPVETDKTGYFYFSQPIPLAADNNNTAEVTIHARKCIEDASDASPNTVPPATVPADGANGGNQQLPSLSPCKGNLVSGKDTITIGQTSFNRTIRISGLAILAIPVIFVISIIVAIVQVGTPRALRWQYYGSILLAFFFSFTMLGYLVVGLAQIDEEGAPGEIFAIGFLNVFHGSYADGGAQSWIVSLTSEGNVVDESEASPATVPPATVPPATVPPATVPPATAPPGLGAPLWVILMSVIGSASYTILLLVGQIPSRIPFETDLVDIRKKVHQIAVHQFYVLIAPLAAVLIYQILVIGKAASQDVMVAIVAFASGLGFNLLLERARQAVERLLINQQRDSSPTPGPNSNTPASADRRVSVHTNPTRDPSIF